MSKTLSKTHARVLATPEERELMDFQREEEKAAAILAENGQVPPNTYWNDANNAAHEVNQTLNAANQLLADRIQIAMASPERRALIKDEAAVASNLNLVGRDIESCRKQLEDIRKMHEGKIGSADTPEDMIQVMQINELYHSALTMYNSNVLPVVAHIFELLGEDAATSQQALEEQTILADRAESMVLNHAETDVNVVTDVVVKNPNNQG